MSKTSIEWTDFSINPIRARNKRTGAVGHFCQMVSPGCAHCYSSNFQKRFHMPAFKGEGKLTPLPVIENGGINGEQKTMFQVIEEKRFLAISGPEPRRNDEEHD